jgi:hypothetical protein
MQCTPQEALWWLLRKRRKPWRTIRMLAHLARFSEAWEPKKC